MLAFKMFYLSCKVSLRDIQYFKNIFNTIQEKAATEDDIVCKIGIEAFRDQYKNSLFLLYTISDGSNNVLISFELEKNSAHIYVLKNKRFFIYRPRNTPKSKLLDIFEKFKIHFKKEDIKITTEDIEKAEQEDKTEDKIQEKKRFEIFNSINFGDISINNIETNLIEKFNNNEKFKFYKDQMPIIDKMKLLIAIKLIINNQSQENSIVTQLKQQFLKDFHLLEEDLLKHEISDVGILAIYGRDKFFSSQEANLRQFDVNPLSKIVKHEKRSDSFKKNGYVVVDYSIKTSNGIKKFSNIRLHNLPSVFLPYIKNQNSLNKWINYEDNKFVLFENIITVYHIDQMYEIKIISISKGDLQNIQDICDSFLSPRKIEGELRRYYPNLETQNRKIMRSNANNENLEILNALDHYRGKIVIEQDDKIIVILAIDVCDKNSKLQNDELKENTMAFDIFIKFILSKFGQNIDF